MRRAIEVAQGLGEEPGAVAIGQFTNPANVLAHYETTGPEILAQLDQVDAFVAGIGTGGTVTGVGKRLREASSKVQIFGVEPKMGERLQGLRNMEEGYVPPLLDFDVLDGRFVVDSTTAIACAKEVAEREGLLVGVSSGAALSAARRVAERMDTGNIVVMFADGGWKYLPARPWDNTATEGERLDVVHWW